MKKSTKISLINLRHLFLGKNDGEKYGVSENQSILLLLLLGISLTFLMKKGVRRTARKSRHAKMLFVLICAFPLAGKLCSGGFCVRFDRANVIFAARFTLTGHGTHIDYLWFLFLVGRICPLDVTGFSLTSFEA